MLRLRGLYYITHINNLPSILKKGILCHRKIEEDRIEFTPIRMQKFLKKVRKNILYHS